MTGFWGHLHPLAAAHGDTHEVRRELSRSLHLGLLISFTGCGVAAVTAPVIISIFYSRAFADAADLAGRLHAGRTMFPAVLDACRLPADRQSEAKLQLGLNLGYIALLVGAGIALIPSLGGGGYVAAHVAASFVMAIAALFIAANRGRINSSLVAKSAAMIVVLTAVAVVLLYGRQAGYLTLALMPLILPFAISGSIMLFRLWQEWVHRTEAGPI